MKGVELYGQVRRAVYVEGLSRGEAARHGVPVPEIDAATKSIRLSRAAAANAEVFRAAKAQAEAQGGILIVDPIDEARPGNT